MSGNGLAPVFFEGGSLVSTGSTPGFALSKPFNFILSGTWVGTVALEASIDQGVTYINCVMPDGSASSFSTNGFYTAPNIWQKDVLFRLTFTRTSGTLDWGISR